MASIYKFKRKRKKENPENGAIRKDSAGEDFFPLLFGDETPLPPQKANVPEPEQESVSEHLDTTREVSLEEIEEKTEKPLPDPGEATRSFSQEESEQLRKDGDELIAAEEAPEKKEEVFLSDDDPTKEIPVELLKALEENHPDEEKMDAVFGQALGSLSASTTKKEYDETTALLRQIFGGDVKTASGGEKPAEEGESPAKEPGAEETGEDGENYVAVHDAQEESTKEYHATFSIQEELDRIPPDESAPSVPEMAQDVRFSDHNPYSDTYDEFDHTTEHSPILPEEYTAEEEYDEFAEHLRNKNFKSVLACFWSFIALVAILYLESATFSGIWHPEFLKPGGIYNMIYLLVDIQLILVSAILVLSSLSDGFVSLFRGKPNRNSLAFAVYFWNLVFPVVLLVTGKTRYPLFGTLAALFGFFLAMANFMDSKRIYRTFRICGKRCDKFVAEKVEGDSPEKEAFQEQLEGDPIFYTVGKARFPDGFFRRVKEPSKKERSFGITLILSFVISLAFAGYTYWREPDLVSAFTGFITMSSMTFPLSEILAFALPFSHLSRKAEQRDCAIVSAAAAEEYANGDVVSFTDNEIFPPKNVKVSTIRTYGQTRIDNAILYGAMIFQKLGGPLSHVFKKTISGVYEEIPENFDFLEITADGMCAKIDGKDVFVGNKNYMLSYDFGYTKDEMDEGFEANSGKIMYMVIGAELAAKFYIHYSISRRFQKTILSLFKCGICPAVKTCDPNIDSDLFRTLLKNDKIPAGIIKTCDAMKDAPVSEKSESGLVCTSSIAGLLRCFPLCDSLRHLTSANIAMKILSILVGAGIVVFLSMIETMTKVSGLFALVYQLLWTLPVIIPSLTE